MFIVICGKETNILNVQSIVTETTGGYKIIYRFRNGATKEETFDTEADFKAKLNQIESAGGGSGGGGITPTGTIQINTNGTHDVTYYASAAINVPQSVAGDYFITSNNYGKAYNMIKKLPTITTSESSLTQLLEYLGNVEEIEGIVATNVTNTSSMFINTTNLKRVGTCQFGTVTTTTQMFELSGIVTAPLFDTSNCTNFLKMFYRCYDLEDVPIYDFSSITGFLLLNMSIFTDCGKLTDQSLDNILQSCITATKVPDSQRKLSNLGISSNYNDRVQTCPHYQDFLDAGWTID